MCSSLCPREKCFFLPIGEAINIPPDNLLWTSELVWFVLWAAEMAAAGSQHQCDGQGRDSAVPRLCRVTLLDYGVWFCLQNQAPQQKSAAILSSPSALTSQPCHFKLPPTIPFSSSDPKAVELWAEPDEPAVGLFWIKRRRRGEFQLCGLPCPCQHWLWS